MTRALYCHVRIHSQSVSVRSVVLRHCSHEFKQNLHDSQQQVQQYSLIRRQEAAPEALLSCLQAERSRVEYL